MARETDSNTERQIYLSLAVSFVVAAQAALKRSCEAAVDCPIYADRWAALANSFANNATSFTMAAKKAVAPLADDANSAPAD